MWKMFLVVMVVMVEATGNLARAEPPAGIPSRIGVDGTVGIGLLEMIGGSLRYEGVVSEATAATARVGHLQVRSIESETRELYPVFIAHAGIRHYSSWFYAAAEGGVTVGSDSRGVFVLPSGAGTLGGKSTTAHVDVGLSIMVIANAGITLCAHLGIDFVSW